MPRASASPPRWSPRWKGRAIAAEAVAARAPAPRVALVGAGLVGSGWAIVFARAGFEVALHDQQPAQSAGALRSIDASLADLARLGLLREPPGAIAARVRVVPSLEAALEGAAYVQESIVERLDAKRSLHAAMDAIAAPGTVLASSTSAFPTSAMAEGLAGRARCIVAHPVNPPYLVPLVEVSGAPFTADDTVQRTVALMRAVGQSPIHVRREAHGFVLNRLQWTLLAEACRLVADGVASVDDVDAAIRDGLGRRWAFIGPFEVGDLNAPGGLRDYLERFGPTIEKINEASGFRLEPAQVEALHAARRVLLPEASRAAQMAWRDRRLMALASHLGGAEPPPASSPAAPESGSV
jgi:3-hydroxyacyl-CoA dehydrogenase